MNVRIKMINDEEKNKFHCVHNISYNPEKHE